VGTPSAEMMAIATPNVVTPSSAQLYREHAQRVAGRAIAMLGMFFHASAAALPE